MFRHVYHAILHRTINLQYRWSQICSQIVCGRIYMLILKAQLLVHTKENSEISPTKMLFGGKIQPKLLQLGSKQGIAEQKEVRDIHDKKKMLQKRAFDKKH